MGQVAQYLYENHRRQFERVLEAMRARVPGVKAVEARPAEDGRLVLRFQDGSFRDPFIARYVSDGTIEMFAYLVLLHDPNPYSLLAVEEPENQLYPSLLGELIEEFRDYARRGGQAFVSTHSPDFLSGAEPKEIYRLQKVDGFSVVRLQEARTRNGVAASEANRVRAAPHGAYARSRSPAARSRSRHARRSIHSRGMPLRP